MKKYDVIIIGTGAANIVTDAALAQGLQVAVIERGRFGGTCLNRGCIPTKVMVTAANRIREIREGSFRRHWRPDEYPFPAGPGRSGLFDVGIVLRPVVSEKALPEPDHHRRRPYRL